MFDKKKQAEQLARLEKSYEYYIGVDGSGSPDTIKGHVVRIFYLLCQVDDHEIVKDESYFLYNLYRFAEAIEDERTYKREVLKV